MSFAGLVPDYNCVAPDDGSNNQRLYFNNSHENITIATMNICAVNGTSCSRYDFIGDANTIITEWDLVCDRKLAKQIVTSLQMGGVLFGALLAGQITDMFGRKKAFFGFQLFHIIMNCFAAYSVSWVMFGVLRFFIGIGIGAILIPLYTYQMEFLPVKWRPILPVIPTWPIGVSVFSIAAMLFKNWSDLHIGCAILSLPSFLCVIFVPESIRWLTLKGKMKESMVVIEKIAKVNGKDIPKDALIVLTTLKTEELKQNQEGKQYTYLDLFRSISLVKVDVVVWFFWFTISMVFYGISFGVASLSGNVYVNIILLAVVELPPACVAFFFQNKVGRKVTTMTCFLLAAISSLGCLLVNVFSEGDEQGLAINVMSMIAKMMIGTAWTCLIIWTSELYPTVVRNLGYGWANMGARVGGIMAPFLINLDVMPVPSYVIMTSCLFTCAALCLTLDETKGKNLSDSLENRDRNVSLEHGVTLSFLANETDNGHTMS